MRRARRSQKNTKTRQTKSRKSRRPESMTLTELQVLAKSRGVPFGGLKRTDLIQRLKQYAR